SAVARRNAYREVIPLLPENLGRLAFFPLDLPRWRLLHGLPALLWRVEGLAAAEELLRERLKPAGFAPYLPQLSPSQHQQQEQVGQGGGQSQWEEEHEEGSCTPPAPPPSSPPAAAAAEQAELLLAATATCIPAARDPWFNND
ncbi:hypothetical protein Agub_g10307, partial [Astrephomene gubernaculifera]